MWCLVKAASQQYPPPQSALFPSKYVENVDTVELCVPGRLKFRHTDLESEIQTEPVQSRQIKKSIQSYVPV